MNQPTENIKVRIIVKTVVFTFIITAILAAAAWYVLIYSRTIALVEPVEETEVKEGSLDFEVVSAGELLPLYSYPVSLPESFFKEFAIEEIGIESIVAEGSRVERGTVIALLDRSVFETQKNKLEAELADIEHKIKDIAVDSTKQLKDVKLALENARLDLEIRKIAVEQSLFDPVSAHERMKLEYSKSTLAYENALLNYQDKRKSLLEKYAALPAQAETLSGEAKAKLSQLERSLEIKSPYSGVFGYPEDNPEAIKGSRKILTPKINTIGEITDPGRLVSRFFLEEELYSSIHIGRKSGCFCVLTEWR
jgi:HlyD family secretion protein